MDKSQRRAEILLIIVTVIWGATFSVTKDGFQDASPLLYLGIRFMAAWIIFSLVRPGVFKKFNKTNIKHGLILGLFMFAGYGLQNLGLAQSSASRTGFINYTFALYVPFLQIFILHRRPQIQNLLGIGVVTIGMFFIANPFGGAFNPGDMLTLISAIAFAFYIVFLDRMAKVSDVDVLTSLQFLVIAVLSFVTAPFVEEVYFKFTPRLVIGIAYLAILGSVVAIFIMTKYQKELSPTKAVLIYALEPVFSVIIAILFFSENFSIQEGIGCGLIMVGVLGSELWSARKERITS